MGQIKITASAVTKEEQLDIARLLVKAGYTVNIRKGKTVDGKGTSFINFMEEREKTMSETGEIMVTVPLSTFIDGVTAKADLDSVRAMLCESNEYCSGAVKAVLGIPTRKEEKSDAGAD